MDNFVFYLAALLAVIVGIFLVKKFVGCMIRVVIMTIMVLVLIALYFLYF